MFLVSLIHLMYPDFKEYGNSETDVLANHFLPE